jgi:hypothetical protein
MREAITRRALFARLVGRRDDPGEPLSTPAETVPRRPVVEAYLDVLDRHRDELAFGVPESELPDAREAIKQALVDALPPSASPAVHEALRDAYTSLVWFTSGDELERLHAGRHAFESSDESEEGKRALVAAFGVRSAKLRERTALGKEFDERVAARLASPGRTA